MKHSKTKEPEQAYEERIAVLESIDPGIPKSIEEVSKRIPESSTEDDLLDAVVLAVTASPLTGDLHTLPEESETDSEKLPMEITYAVSS